MTNTARSKSNTAKLQGAKARVKIPSAAKRPNRVSVGEVWRMRCGDLCDIEASGRPGLIHARNRKDKAVYLLWQSGHYSHEPSASNQTLLDLVERVSLATKETGGKDKKSARTSRSRQLPIMSNYLAGKLAEEHGLQVADFEWVCAPCRYVSDYCFGHGKVCTRCGGPARPRLKAEVGLRLSATHTPKEKEA